MSVQTASRAVDRGRPILAPTSCWHDPLLQKQPFCGHGLRQRDIPALPGPSYQGHGAAQHCQPVRDIGVNYDDSYTYSPTPVTETPSTESNDSSSFEEMNKKAMEERTQDSSTSSDSTEYNYKPLTKKDDSTDSESNSKYPPLQEIS